MSGVKHTPGPWEAHKTIEAHDGMPECWQIDAEHDAVCTTQFCYAPNTEANARLIASAPDHHAVALELDRLALVIDSAVRFADPAFKDEVQALLRANKDAIARARGEQDGGGE
ncbi:MULTISPECIES: hypothetical protein [Brevundimonas]|uniref:hypothetical protein n=1 Tax=Brevundimonas sp. UBA7507 TaxID=1946137 RepID=UPI00257E71D8|nr:MULTISPECIES: hypothetical protein [Brevundimonas]